MYFIPCPTLSVIRTSDSYSSTIHLFIWSQKFWGKDMNLNCSSYQVINETFTFIFFFLYIYTKLIFSSHKNNCFLKQKTLNTILGCPQLFVFVEDIWGQFQSLCLFDMIKYALPLLWHFLGKAVSLEMFDLVQSGLWRGHSGNIDLFLSHCSIVLAASVGLLSPWKLNILKPKLQEDISVYFPNSVYLNSPGSEFFYLMTCCFYSDMHCKLWNLT